MSPAVIEIDSKKPIAPRLLSRKEQKFAALIASGTPQGTAYEMAGYGAKTQGSRRVNGHKLANRPDILQYIQKLKEKAWEAEAMGEAETKAYLARVIRTPLEEITPSSPLCAEYEETVSPEGHVKRKIKKYSMMSAIAEQNKMNGCYYGDKQGNTTNPFGSLIALVNGNLVLGSKDSSKES